MMHSGAGDFFTRTGDAAMIGALLRWIFRSAVLTVLLRVVSRLFPSLRKILRIIFR
jgi:hypothetical protein